MRVISLLDSNSSVCGATCAHGLSLYIETTGKTILFDVGPNGSFAENAKLLNLDISAVDMLVLSHGHADHGGGLSFFTELNKTAAIYASPNCFEEHFSCSSGTKRYIGVKLPENARNRVIPCGEYFSPAEGIAIVANTENSYPLPTLNVTLSDAYGSDKFTHERSLLISENGYNCLFSACSHNGAANIVKTALRSVGHLDAVFCGLHTEEPTAGKRETEENVLRIGAELSPLADAYYLLHCTGDAAFKILRERFGEKFKYFNCTDEFCNSKTAT